MKSRGNAAGGPNGRPQGKSHPGYRAPRPRQGREMPEAPGSGTGRPEDGGMIAGRNAVLEALRAGRELDTIWIAEEEEPGTGGFSGKLRALARDSGAVVKSVSRMKLDALVPGVRHQGVVASLCAGSYVEVSVLLEQAEQAGRPPFLVIADEIEDPHNLGAIIRTAEACGADGLILPQRRSASLTATVYKTSAGAAGVLPVARVSNLVSCIRELKKRNIWIYGADMDGQSWCTLDYRGGIAIVIGSEGRGISRLVREECDFIVSLPMAGQINSLNASVAAGIILYEAARQRGGFEASAARTQQG